MAALPISGPSSFTIKRQREAVIRSIADSVETRNWNIMVDVIAQSGRFRTGATAGSGFLTEGESRSWQFTSLDRFSATVLDQLRESVAE